MAEESSAFSMFWARSLMDTPPPRVVLYLFGQMPENEAEVLDRGAEWVLTGRAKFVCVPEQFGKGHPPNAEPWRVGLCERGVPEERILALETTEDDLIGSNGVPSTLSESKMLLRECMRRGWRNLGVTAATFHQARAFLTVISEAIRTWPELNVYSIPAEPGDWDKVVLHSYGSTTDARVSMIPRENGRITSFSNLVPLSQALAYLSRRG